MVNSLTCRNKHRPGPVHGDLRQKKGTVEIWLRRVLLLVDHDLNICDLLRLYFENEGYEVKTANDGAEGVTFFKMYEPDLVLLDIMLPKKDGWQVCREIREVSSKPDNHAHR